IAVDERGPCRAGACGEGTACVKSTGICEPVVSGCQPACSATQACVNTDGSSRCAAVQQGGTETYPRAIGGYLSLAESPGGGFGVAAYDAFRGNLVAYRQDGGSW